MDEERDPVIQEAADILGIEYNDFLCKTAVRESQWIITCDLGIFNHLTDEEFDRAIRYNRKPCISSYNYSKFR
ncbi:hypothetical protein KK075_003028 [Escherichia coli]|nr:hypothetical protein [Escherichia coli]EIB8314442.1 hypothetical protein [Escherichia coli]ELS9459238.1 hypothetical protein [Escherichia coli]ELW1472428.1 hypothetical protein [Escherichia coli]ELY7481017.1 hypothetical protein [Escherichia coli]